MSKANFQVHIEVTGADSLLESLAYIGRLDGVRKTVAEDTDELKRIMLKNEQFVRGYSTGATKRSTDKSIYNEGLTGEVGAKTEYIPFVEKGTSKMTPEPFAQPSYNEIKHKFKADVKKNLGRKR